MFIGTSFFFIPNPSFTLKPVDPAAMRQLLGCQSSAVIVDLIGFLMCFATHQSFSWGRLKK
jgi:hypothetical protein